MPVLCLSLDFRWPAVPRLGAPNWGPAVEELPRFEGFTSLRGMRTVGRLPTTIPNFEESFHKVHTRRRLKPKLAEICSKHLPMASFEKLSGMLEVGVSERAFLPLWQPGEGIVCLEITEVDLVTRHADVLYLLQPMHLPNHRQTTQTQRTLLGIGSHLLVPS